MAIEVPEPVAIVPPVKRKRGRPAWKYIDDPAKREKWLAGVTVDQPNGHRKLGRQTINEKDSWELTKNVIDEEIKDMVYNRQKQVNGFTDKQLARITNIIKLVVIIRKEERDSATKLDLKNLPEEKIREMAE